jgi:hypothetical protein
MKSTTITLVALGLGLSACKTETKSKAELLFPPGVHTWNKGEDNRADPPSDDCTGCPGIDLTSPDSALLDASGWSYTLPSLMTHLQVQGTISGLGTSNCGANNDRLCSNEWRIWPPGSGDSAYSIETPGGDNRGALIDFDGSFLCGKSRVVIVAENTYGLTRAIFDVTRSGGLCAVASAGHTLNVRLTWDEVVDLDLHLVEPGSYYGSSTDVTGGDCYYGNCRASASAPNQYGTSDLDWGVAYDDTDNPLLDVDNTYGYGPENIFLFKPEAGVFKIGVHYYTSSGPSTYPTIEVFVDGEFLNSVVAGRTGGVWPNEVWHAADVTISASGLPVWTPVDTIGGF